MKEMACILDFTHWKKKWLYTSSMYRIFGWDHPIMGWDPLILKVSETSQDINSHTFSDGFYRLWCLVLFWNPLKMAQQLRFWIDAVFMKLWLQEFFKLTRNDLDIPKGISWMGEQPPTWLINRWLQGFCCHCSIEQWNKCTWFFGIFVEDEILPSYKGSMSRAIIRISPFTNQYCGM